MDNLDDSENNAKVSDSAYSNSCSNSQSRRSHSSKSTHSGSNSSGSSGYGSKKPASGYGSKLSTLNSQPPEKRNKEKSTKTKQPVPTGTVTTTCVLQASAPENTQQFVIQEEVKVNAVQLSSAAVTQTDNEVEEMDISVSEKNSVKDEAGTVALCSNTPNTIVANRFYPSNTTDGFSCVISMHDGVVMYATATLTTTLGFPKDMWIGRSFIEFVHPRDRDSLAALITNGLAAPNANGTQKKANATDPSPSTVCRIRKYRGLSAGFGVKEHVVTFMPFFLKLSFKNISDEEGQVIYLVIQATPIFSAFKSPNEVVNRSVPFVIRHAANGNFEFLDPESVPYLGYLPQDVTNKNALMLYHHDDLQYLRQVYETIVREGSTPRGKSYRILAQNGGFIKVETEWSSFINPWSKKLEFVIGKHYIIEGPLNPDVFQSPESDKGPNMTEEDKKIAQSLRESILRIMNEVLTKPAELAKQQMTKRCQDLASFMETLMEEPTKAEEELRVEIQDCDHSYYERDSVMLGGISPHHEYDDGKSSTETPLSYNQLNYNETLTRYFENHQPFCDDFTAVTAEHVKTDCEPSTSHRKSPLAFRSMMPEPVEEVQPTVNSLAMNQNEIATLGEYQNLRLTEYLLNKHNTDMEKELLKKHRELRPNTKTEREKLSKEKRSKKKEHLARCSESFTQASQIGLTIDPEPQPHGIKRPSKHVEPESNKQHCSSFRQLRKKLLSCASGIPNVAACSTTIHEQKSPWAQNTVSSMNTFIFGVGLPQQMPIMDPMSTVPGVFPMYYASTHAGSTMINPTKYSPCDANKTNTGFPPPMHCMMYGQAVYGSPFMYSALPPPVTYNVQENITATSLPSMNPLGLTCSHYEEVCKTSMPVKPTIHNTNLWQQHQKRCESQNGSFKTDQGSGNSNSSKKALNRSTDAVTDTSGHGSINRMHRHGNPSEDTMDRTDGESSYSSFYSSFFKTESCSADDSSDAKKPKNAMDTRFEPNSVKKMVKRKIDPPWLEQVSVTPNLMYKYQITNKSMDEVLLADKKKISAIEQSSLVNEQLEQLYLDLQTEGIAARLTLEEGITSSSSSGEETTPKTTKVLKSRRKREFSKLVMIYEEDAPFPPPLFEPEQPTPSTSNTML